MIQRKQTRTCTQQGALTQPNPKCPLAHPSSSQGRPQTLPSLRLLCFPDPPGPQKLCGLCHTRPTQVVQYVVALLPRRPPYGRTLLGYRGMHAVPKPEFAQCGHPYLLSFGAHASLLPNKGLVVACATPGAPLVIQYVEAPQGIQSRSQSQPSVATPHSTLRNIP